MSIGEVKSCAHCSGTGTCGTRDRAACLTCSRAAGSEGRQLHSVVCSACGGKGSVWVGPDIVQIPQSNL
jgi:RecJ-like exonuclease